MRDKEGEEKGGREKGEGADKITTCGQRAL